MKKIVAGAFALVCFISHAQQCSPDSVRSVTSDGEVLVTLGGKVFEILAGDQVTVMLWLSMDDILICGPKSIVVRGRRYTYYTVINTDDKEQVDAVRIK
jgi:hypothetical protein